MPKMLTFDELKQHEVRAALCAEATLTGEQLREILNAVLRPIGWCCNCEKATIHERRGVDLCCSECHFIAFCYHERIT